MRITLQPLTDDPLEIELRNGTVLKADPELTGKEALFFMRDGRNIEGDIAIERWSAALSRCLLPFHPDYTPDKVLEVFTVTDLIQIVMGFLGRTGPPPSRTSRTNSPTRTTTRKRKR